METAKITSRQLDRSDCRLGDWVRAVDIPEWRDEEVPRRYTPGSVVISPEAGVIGGVVPAEHPEQWIFTPVELNGERVWRRDR